MHQPSQKPSPWEACHQCHRMGKAGSGSAPGKAGSGSLGSLEPLEAPWLWEDTLPSRSSVVFVVVVVVAVRQSRHPDTVSAPELLTASCKRIGKQRPRPRVPNRVQPFPDRLQGRLEAGRSGRSSRSRRHGYGKIHARTHAPTHPLAHTSTRPTPHPFTLACL